MKEFAVKCERVTKRYDHKHALNEFSARIPSGGVVGILGPNGSGKSTLFRLLTGMSRGQEARLMLILCIARQVPLVILDEPFSGIDAISREQIIHSLIEYLSERDHTVLISTHEVYEAESLFDHVIFMNEGQVGVVRGS